MPVIFSRPTVQALRDIVRSTEAVQEVRADCPEQQELTREAPYTAREEEAEVQATAEPEQTAALAEKVCPTPQAVEERLEQRTPQRQLAAVTETRTLPQSRATAVRAEAEAVPATTPPTRPGTAATAERPAEAEAEARATAMTRAAELPARAAPERPDWSG